MISFEPLWKTLKDRKLNKTELQRITRLSSATIAKLSKNESVMLDVVDRICEGLDCGISEVIEVEHVTKHSPNHALVGNGSEGG